MKHRIVTGLCVIAALLVIGNISYGQYTVTGNTPGGGVNIIGNGNLPALGPGAPLSAGGFDSVTLNIGSIATASGQNTIVFGTSNDTLLNNGTVIGGPATGNNGFDAIRFINAAGALSGEMVTNNGSATGGIGGSFPGGNGILFLALTTLSNITVTDAGNATGGAGNVTGGSGGHGIYLASDAMSGVSITVTDTGNATGGAGGSAGGDAGHGIYLFTSSGAMSNITLNDSGNATGGSASAVGVGGDGIFLSSAGSMSGVVMNVSGNATGGAAVDSTGGAGIKLQSGDTMSGITLASNNATGGNSSGSGLSGDGISLASTGAMSNVTVASNNARGGDGAGAGGEGIFLNSETAMTKVTVTSNNATGGKSGGILGGNGGDGIFIAADTGVLSSITVTSGNATGNSSPTGPGGRGITLFSQVDINNVMVTSNNAIGGDGLPSISGGIGIQVNSFGAMSYVRVASNNATGGAAGDGISLKSTGDMSNVMVTSNNATGGPNNVVGSGGNGIDLNSGGAMSNVMVASSGNATGGVGPGGIGNGGDGISIMAGTMDKVVLMISSGNVTGGNGGIGGDGIRLQSSSGATGATVTSFGSITGGNAGTGGAAGFGALFFGNGYTLNNLGSITAGGGLAPIAIGVFGNNNVVNLNGHSSVNGLIKAAGAANSNVLSLNFTGLSPAAIAGLRAQLSAQALLTGQDSAGTFTVRNVIYNYDPFVLNLNVSSYQLQGFTPNQQAVGISLDSAAVNPVPGSSLFNLFNAIDLSGNVPGALEALSPQPYEAYGDLAIANSTATVQEVDQRLNNVRDGSESVDTTGVGGTTTAGFSKDDGKESKEVAPAPAEKRWGFFATGNGLFFRGNSHDVDLQEARSNTAGTVAGVDAKVGDNVILGALFAYDNAAATLGSNGSHATIESYTGGIYGSWHKDGFYVNGLAAYTRNNYSSQRNITIPGFLSAATGSTDGNQCTVNLDGGYDWHMTDRLTMGPLAGVQYVHLDVDSFNEAGAGAANLAVGSQSVDSLQSRVGGRINYHLMAQDNVSFAADLHAAWQHEFMNDSRGIGGTFIGSGLAPFSIQTVSPMRDAAVVGVGLNFTFHEKLTLFADYELLFWRASYFEQTINGGCRISF